MRRWLTWNVLFRLQELAKGHDTLRMLRDMEEADRLSAPALQALQMARLRTLLESSYRHVPHVRRTMQKAGVSPADIRQLADLRRLPIMTKADIRSHRLELRSDTAERLSPFTTGGSTGEPLIFDLGKQRIAARVACRQRVARWWGVSVGDPEIALWGSPIELTRQDWVRGVRDRLLATRLLSAFEMNDARMTEYLDILQSQGCRQLFGYPSAVYLLCLQAQKERRDLRTLGVKVVFVTGEVLFPHQRKLISATFDCGVADGYGGRDSGFISHECPEGGMHILSDAVVVEIVDSAGQPVAAGQSGEIVVTDLYSAEAPFIRYATGDIGVESSRVCPCGRALPLLEHIEGRSNDLVLAPDGRLINSLALVYPLRGESGIEQYRITQKQLDWFHVQLTCSAEFQAQSEERIRAGWTQLLRAPVRVTFEYLPRIPPDPRGKFRHVVSEIPAASRGAAEAPVRRGAERPLAVAGERAT
jgi:phenylacetate-CoA ligase